jgi:hypothetical protein
VQGIGATARKGADGLLPALTPRGPGAQALRAARTESAPRQLCSSAGHFAIISSWV